MPIYEPVSIGDFHITAMPFEHYCDFRCVECVGAEHPEGGWIYTTNDADQFPNEHDPVKAMPFIEGHIKWDGCSNLRFPEQDQCALHFYERMDALKISRLLNRLYDLASELIPRWDKNQDLRVRAEHAKETPPAAKWAVGAIGTKIVGNTVTTTMGAFMVEAKNMAEAIGKGQMIARKCWSDADGWNRIEVTVCSETHVIDETGPVGAMVL